MQNAADAGRAELCLVFRLDEIRGICQATAILWITATR